MTQLIRRGDVSEEVADVQARLRALGYEIDDPSSHFEAGTEAAVRTFQQHRSMLVDGIVGPQTWSQLVEASWRLGDRTLYLKRPFMRGDDVGELQRRLNALGFDAGREDGIFGPLALNAIKAFQREYGLVADGLFGAQTLGALQGLRVDRRGTAAQIREELRHRGRAIEGRLIVIDPGHGPNDPGSVGPNGLRENEVCWKLADLVAQRLATTGALVRFTRAEPEDVDRSERAARANEMDADIFVSLHLNDHDEPTAEGSSAYYFVTSRAGEALADAIQSRLVSLGSRDCRTHARSFDLLRETKMPAVMVEPAFLTNPDEAKRLEDHDHLATIAAAISDGIKDYFIPN